MFNTKISLQENYVHVQLPLCKLYHWKISRYYPVLLHVFFYIESRVTIISHGSGHSQTVKSRSLRAVTGTSSMGPFHPVVHLNRKVKVFRHH